MKKGYIEKEICLEDLNADKIIDMYEAAVRDHEFPDEEGLQEIRDRVDRILMSMRESRG